MRKSIFARAISGFLIFSYSLTSLGADSRTMRDIRPLSKAQSLTVQSVKDFSGFYKELKDAYEAKGPKAFVDKLSFVEDKVGREEILKTLSKLPPLPKLKECGETCVSFEYEGKVIKVGVGNLVAGHYTINDQEFHVDFAKDSFNSTREEIRAHLSKTLVKSDVRGNILTDTFSQVCRLLIPEAHAEWSTTTSYIVLGLVAIAAALLVFFVGKHLIDKANRDAKKIVREAERGAKRRIRHAAEHGEQRINDATDAGVQSIEDAQGSGGGGSDMIDPPAPVIDTSVDSGGYAPDTDPVISDEGGRGEVRDD